MFFELSLRQLNVVQNLTINFFKIYFNNILLYVAQSPELSLAACFPIKILYAVLIPFVRATNPAHLNLPFTTP